MFRNLLLVSRVKLMWWFGLIALAATTTAIGQEAGSNPLGSLKDVSVPKPSDWSDFVKDNDKAVALGKALFWDNEVGFDGQACASCHFHAGADSRIKNQISPHGESLITRFNEMMNGPGGPNYTLTVDDFPLFLLEDTEDRNSSILYDTDDVVSSMGVQKAIADQKGHPVTGEDGECSISPDIVFHVAGINTRKVEPRNTPTVINAAFNFRQFWDGRANNRFNGVNPFGPRSTDASVLRNSSSGLRSVSIDLENASLAAQAVGPVLSTLEMNCGDRLFKEVGRKLLSKPALETQQVDAKDSVLGNYAASPLGLDKTYSELVQLAFKDEWWNSHQSVNGYSQMESNFSLFFGLALQAYQSTLISDDSPFDRYMHGDSTALSSQELEGFGVFVGKGKCTACHDGPELSSAATHLIGEDEEGGLVERMSMAKLFNSDGSSSEQEPINLALGKATSQSSENSGGHSSRAVDGQTSGTWNHGSVTHTNNQSKPWWQVDLGEHYGVSTIRLFNRTDCCSNRLSNFYVFTSSTNMSGRSLSDLLHDSTVNSTYYEGAAPSVVSVDIHPTLVRYVRVQLAGSNVLSLAEVEVYDIKPKNLAVGKRTSQSSENSGGHSSRAVDGRTSGTWNHGSVTHTNNQSQPWWQVDLGAGYDVSTISLYNRTDCCSNRLSNFYVITSSTDMTGRSLSDLLGDSTVKSIYHEGEAPSLVDINITPRNVRYVRVQLAGSNVLSLAEVEIYEAETFSALYDNGFYNIGVTPTKEDIGVGGHDPWGNPLSFTRQSKFRAAGFDDRAPDNFFIDPHKLEVDSGHPIDPKENDAVDGSFKTPILRNLTLTGPYFHNGGTLTLEQLVEFYNRGGDRQNQRGYSYGDLNCDTTGFTEDEINGVEFGNECSNLDPDIEHLGLSEHEKAALVAFLKTLTDDRVRWERAPFDHPALAIPVGHVGDDYHVSTKTLEGGVVADDEVLVLPAVGRNGRGVLGLKPLAPIQDLMECAKYEGNFSCFSKFYSEASNTIFKFDVNTDASPTEDGFTGLVGNPGSTAYESGVAFTLFGFHHGANRDRGVESSLLTDFAFQDSNGGGVGLRIVGLPAGRYQVHSWHYDADGHNGSVKVEYRVRGGSPTVLVPHHDITNPDAVSYTIESNGHDDYELVFRETGHHNRSRFNGIVILPEGDFTPAAADQVIMFEHSDFRGNSWSVGEGEYPTDALNHSPVGNNRISSMLVPEGYEVEVCHHDLSRCRIFDSSVTNFNGLSADGHTLNDAISSFIVAPAGELAQRVTVFEHAHFRGNSWSVGEGDYPYDVLRHSAVGNDRISSMRVPEGFAVEVCRDDYADCRVFEDTVTDFNGLHVNGRSLNDAISSFRVFALDDNWTNNPPPAAVPPSHAIQCGIEHQYDCVLPPGVIATVWFGADHSWNVQTGLTGTVACNTSTFGDPIRGTNKACFYVAQ